MDPSPPLSSAAIGNLDDRRFASLNVGCWGEVELENERGRKHIFQTRILL